MIYWKFAADTSCNCLECRKYPILNNQCSNRLQIDAFWLVLHWVFVIVQIIALADDAVTFRGFAPVMIYWKVFAADVHCN
ncbi:hypothetical protein FH5T_21375 [Draconibacterium orientale]|uniref:Uncharacterized protein n=1 Tax=Draconibacterium orientale TaxID=1168034 RepID=A0ABM5QFQ5_9BACT|nr:hypothetical protein FH5T_21375 [Draconibacterium orientale]